MRSYSKISIVLLSIFIIIGSSTAAGKLKLVILHTNDTHSQIEPTQKSTLASSDMGGYARRMGVINKISKEGQEIEILDNTVYNQEQKMIFQALLEEQNGQTFEHDTLWNDLLK